MNNNLTIFNYEANEVRTIEKDGQPYFVLADVCKVLGISNPTDVSKRLDNDERARFNLGRQGNATIVNESGLYAVILRSDKPQAKAFRKWITAEVLPSIRKTGSYITQPNIDTAPKKPTNSEEIIKIRKANLLYKLLKDSAPSIKPLIQSQIVEMLTGKILQPMQIPTCCGYKNKLNSRLNNMNIGTLNDKEMIMIMQIAKSLIDCNKMRIEH